MAEAHTVRRNEICLTTKKETVVKRNFLFALCVIFLFFCEVARAQEIPYWTIEELLTMQPGTKGYGLSVFKGSEPERFEAEILGISDAGEFLLVIAELRAPILDRTGNVIAGMSGSPVYVGGKLVGALAYAWEFERVAIAGIVPFEYMKREEVARRTNDFLSLLGLRQSDYGIPSAITVSYRGNSLALPLLSSMSSSEPPFFLGLLSSWRGKDMVSVADDFGWVAMEKEAYVSVGERKLKPGSALSVAFIEGDKSYAVTGTVTAREGDTIYAFGHPILRDGVVQYPSRGASITTVMPGFRESFKMKSAQGYGERAVIEYDGMFGIYGTVGKEPETIPVTLSFSRREETVEIKSRVVYGKYVPDLVKVLTVAFLEEYSEFLGSSTIKIEGRIKPQGLGEVFTENLYTAGSYTERDPILKQFIETSPYFDALVVLLREDNALRFESLRLDFRVVAPDQKLFVVEGVFPYKEFAKPGESFSFSVVVAEQNGVNAREGRKRYAALLDIEIPRDASPGTITVLIEGGEHFTDRRFGQKHFLTTIEEVIENLNRTVRNDRLYVSMFLPWGGAKERVEPAIDAKGTGLHPSPGTRGEVLLDWKEMARSPYSIWQKEDPVAVIELPFPPGFTGVIEGGLAFQIEVKPKRSFLNF